MNELSAGEAAALANLGVKKSGADVGWINIADACSLTRRGYAERTRQGWMITAAGIQTLAQSQTQKEPDAT